MIHESLVSVEFITAVSGAMGKDRLVPEDIFEAARCRIWADRVNKECCSPYYKGVKLGVLLCLYACA